MSTAKAEVAAMLAAIPENSTLEDIRYHIDVMERITRSLERVRREGAISDDAAMKRLDKWLTD
ncbi:MAG: hypothetical protein ISP90_13200 [Nevskia sp.]|nr:hypothetical protein [Nevskia sp.]